MRKGVIRAGLEAFYATGIHRLAAPFLSGVGVILTFHRVRPAREGAFQPNQLLEVTPDFLEETIAALKGHDIEVVPIDELPGRLREGGRRRFAVLTFDDGYRDNLEYALPVLNRHCTPFTLYVPSAFMDGTGELWWLAIEEAVAGNDKVEVTLGGATRTFDCADPEAKCIAYSAIHDYLVDEAGEGEFVEAYRGLAARYDIDLAARCREECMTWDELAVFARDPLCTVGGHSVSHQVLSKLSPDAARAEIVDGNAALEAHTGAAPAHFSYPVGTPAAASSREFATASALRMKTAVTTRPGVLFPEHADHLTALPRISVNGEFQKRRYLDVLLSGAPTGLLNRFRRVNAA